MRKILGVIGLMGLIGLIPVKPINPIHAQDTNTIDLRIDGYLFFIDDEYFGRRIEGYTLPGFRLNPKVVWTNDKHLTLSGGVSWLHYWGAHSYPNTMSYSVLPDYSDTATIMHIVPWLQAKLHLADWLELTLGSFDPDDYHYLPTPLRDIEREVAADPECGLMLSAWGDMGEYLWGTADWWIDWREFIWNNSPRQERFTMGLSGRIYYDIPLTNLTLVMPLHFLAQHVGGQVLATTTPIQNNFNAASGLGIQYNMTEPWAVGLHCLAMCYHQHGNTAVPFTQGWGLYPMLKVVNGKRLAFEFSYWQGERFVPLLGSWLYSNLSSVDGTTVFDRTQILSFTTYYNWRPKGEPFNLHIGGSAHYDIGEQQMQFAVHCALAFWPSIRLH
ncbi:MAG: hypothetical protein J6X79_00445 [Bacteroidales bacterium]|nr:hypothetical protein [Bacteroidales bacterium]